MTAFVMLPPRDSSPVHFIHLKKCVLGAKWKGFVLWGTHSDIFQLHF